MQEIEKKENISLSETTALPVQGKDLSSIMKSLEMGVQDFLDGDQARYAKIAGHGFKMLAEAIEAELPYRIECPALLICGEKDQAGSCIRYDRAWHKNTGIRIEWIKDAGHNSNTDAPERVNQLIQELVLQVRSQK